MVHASEIHVLPMLNVLNSRTPTIIMKWYIDAIAIKALKEMEFRRVLDAIKVKKCHGFLCLFKVQFY